MGILIEGIEMPTTCGQCRIKNAIECDRWKLVRSVVLDRHMDCPLSPVLEPHGRLIDSDVLREKFPRPQDWMSIAQALVHITGIWAEIDNAPTIIPATNKELVNE